MVIHAEKRMTESASRPPITSRLFDLVLAFATVFAALSAFYGSSEGTEIGTATAFYLVSSLIWITLGLVYTAIRASRIHRARKGDAHWATRLAGRRTAWLMITGTAVIVLSSGANLISAKGGEDDNSILVEGLSVVMVLVAWTILQLTYAERYARLYLSDTSGTPPLEFPATPHPSLLEFAYFSFTVGVTFGTSDVSIQSTRWRGIVLCHGLLVFVYNTAVIGMVLSLISG
ncbi:DUF1345 domain-containing protein [Actinoplanes sp. TFC3]|uniref:DUF1345 domain-containing protein n=1 Tax=Actinoplanes sp. TFC3 TaxID=1710355 RepID=UPI0009E97991|nr:DUF1345 domain-containing protein [Actinoplanes sp. TFC3]